MRGLATIFLAVAFSFGSARLAEAQLNTNDNTQNAGNVSGQTGQSQNFTIQRDANAFIGGAATNFLSGQTAGTQLGGLGGGGLFGGVGGLGGFGRGNMGFNNQQNLQQNTAEPQIRFRITLGFSHPRPAATAVSANFSKRLTRIPQLSSADSVEVTMEDRTAVLVGQVGSEHERTMIEKLAMMEPGVSAVRNELTVKESQELLPPPVTTN